MAIAIEILDGLITIFLTLFLFSEVNKNKLSIREIFCAILVRIPLAAFWIILMNVTGSDLSYFDTPIYLLVLTFMYLKPLPKTLYIFYGLFPITLWNLFYRSIIFFILPLFRIDENIMETILWFNLSYFVIILLVLAFLKWLQYDFVRLRKGLIDSRDRDILYFANWMMVGYYVLIETFSYIEFEQQVDTLDYRKLLVIIYLILFMGVLNRLDKHLRERIQEKLDFQQELQLRDMEDYSRHIEELYKEVRGFRHDYSNLLTTLSLGIEEGNLSQIKEVYNSVLKDSNKQFRNNKYDVGRLTNIKNSALKSLMAAKFIQASENGITINLEIPEEIQPQGIEVVDFITIVSILCDNAIEACQEVDKPSIQIAYLFLEGKQIFVIENTIKQESVDIANIFELDTSSKGDNRGVGLYNVMKILDMYPNVTLNTSSHDYSFRQVLEIKL